MATLGMSEVEREAVERLQRDVIEPSMTNIVLLDFESGSLGPGRANIDGGDDHDCAATSCVRSLATSASSMVGGNTRL